MDTKQIDFWKGDFGKNYTDRNSPATLDEWHSFYKATYGVTRIQMHEEFIADLSRDAKILEVGCNTGFQLRGLQSMGFKNLYGVELQNYAVEKSKTLTKGINIIQGSGFDLPFKDNYFDLVMTNGVLIHIAPNDLSKFMSEVSRCSKQFVMGFEYYEDDMSTINYRGNNDVLWKADYSNIYLQNCPELKMVKEVKYPYITEAEKGNINAIFLLEKTTTKNG